MDIKAKIKDGYIEKILYNNENIINPWSLEAADSYSAFRLTDDGISVKIKKKYEFQKSENVLNGQIDVKASQGKWKINYQDKITKGVIYRKAKLTAINESLLMDFVVRYRFKKELFDFGIINGLKIEPRSSFIYHQFETDQVELFGKKISCKIKFINHTQFKDVIYISDKSDEWVIHCRVLPEIAHDYILKLSTFWYNKALPKTIAKPIIANKKLRDLLLYRGERKPYKRPLSLLSPNIYPIMKLNKGESIFIKSSCEFE